MKRKHILAGAMCGGITSILLNLSIIFFIFIESEVLFFVSFLPAFFCCAIIVFLLKNTSWKGFFKGTIFAFIIFWAAEIVLLTTGVIRYFYRLQYGDIEMAPVFGVIVIMYHIIYFVLNVIGASIACILTAIKIKSTRKQEATPCNHSN